MVNTSAPRAIPDDRPRFVFTGDGVRAVLADRGLSAARSSAYGGRARATARRRGRNAPQYKAGSRTSSRPASCALARPRSPLEVRRFRFPAWGRIGFPLTAAPRARARRQDPALPPLARDALRARRHERRRPAPRGSVPGRVSEGGCLTARGSTHRAESRTARLYRPHLRRPPLDGAYGVAAASSRSLWPSPPRSPSKTDKSMALCKLGKLAGTHERPGCRGLPIMTPS